MNCTNISLDNNMTTLVLTMDNGAEHRFPCKGSFHGGDFKPAYVEKVLRLLVSYYYPKSVTQIDAIKLFRRQVSQLSIQVNKFPHLSMAYRGQLPGIYESAKSITQEGTEAFKLYRSALRVINSFASGQLSDEDPEVVQARREAYEEKKRKTASKNIAKTHAR